MTPMKRQKNVDTRIFYKFVEPRKSEEIFAEFKELSDQEQELMKKILGE